jgi:hypothetical protein
MTGDIKLTQTSFLDVYNTNFDLQEVIMACDDTGLQDIALAINNLATATSSSRSSASSDCSCGSANNGFAQGYIALPGGGAIPINGTQPPLVFLPGQLPPGYTDPVAYGEDKCALATGIVDGWIESLRYIGALATFQFIALAGLVVAGIASLIVFPPAAIPLMMTALAVLGTGLAITTQLSVQLQGKRQEVICILYEGESAEGIISAYSAVLDTIIALIPASGAVAVALKTIGLLLANTDTLNQLFTGQGSAGLPAGSCLGCGGSWELHLPGQTAEEVEPGVWVLTSTNTPCGSQVNSLSAAFSEDFNGTISVETGSLNTMDDGGDSCRFIYRAFQLNGVQVWGQTNTPPVYPILIDTIVVRSTVPFSLRIVMS